MFGAGGVIAAENLPVVADGVKPGTIMPFAGDVAPSGCLFCYGQAVSRTTYAALFAVIGTTYGAGDGSTTFALPDLRGRVPGGKDDMGGSAASRLNVTINGTRGSTANGNITGLSSTTGLSIGMRAIGAGIGTNAVITAITSGTAVTLSANNTATGTGPIRFGVVDGATLGAAGGSHVHALGIEQIPAHTHTYTNLGDSGGSAYTPGGEQSANSTLTTSSAGGGQAHPNLPPTLVVNYVIKT